MNLINFDKLSIVLSLIAAFIIIFFINFIGLSLIQQLKFNNVALLSFYLLISLLLFFFSLNRKQNRFIQITSLTIIFYYSLIALHETLFYIETCEGISINYSLTTRFLLIIVNLLLLMFSILKWLQYEKQNMIKILPLVYGLIIHFIFTRMHIYSIVFTI